MKTSAHHRANGWSGQRRDVVEALLAWTRQGMRSVLATAISTDSSAPRGIGAQLAIRQDGHWVGGLSGGCAENEILHEAAELLHSTPEGERSGVLIHLTRDDFSSAGPICGATLGVLIEVVDHELLSAWTEVRDHCGSGELSTMRRTWAVALRPNRVDERVTSAMPDLTLNAGTVSVARQMSDVATGDVPAMSVSLTDTELNLSEDVSPAPHLMICGGGDVAADLIHFATRLGWRTTLLDSRQSWIDTTVEHAQPTCVVRGWPRDHVAGHVDRLTACIACAHDGKLDLPFLEAALTSPAFYVGSVGSKVTQAERNSYLVGAVGAEAAGRHRGPAGLPVADNSAAGIALSIISEVSQLRLAAEHDGSPLATPPIS